VYTKCDAGMITTYELTRHLLLHATGLFTRRFAKSGDYSRVIACDYSDSMITEARRRIRADPEIASSPTKLDLVRCDVAKIPMKSDSIDAFHAGAAMHCWPNLHRVLES